MHVDVGLEILENFDRKETIGFRYEAVTMTLLRCGM
jgi:hypothetical protein